MDGLVAGAADDQRFPLASRHDLHPDWFLPAPLALEVRQLAEVVDLTVAPGVMAPLLVYRRP